MLREKIRRKKKSSLDKPAVNLMLDSGAYSAWKSGNPIDLEQYAEYLEKTGLLVQCYVNLDVIPGERGDKHPSSAEVEESAKRGWQNYLCLKKMGLHPIPVFHRGERMYWLEKMLGEGVTYLGLGGIAFGSFGMRLRWLEEVFAFLCGDRGWPPVKLHGFGVASPELMTRFPWYSVDTTSWRTPALYGKVYVPRLDTVGRVTYEVSPQIVIINDRQRISEFGNQQTLWKKMGTQTAAYVKEYFESLGFDFDTARNSDVERRRMLVRYLQAVMQNHKPVPFRSNGLSGFFSATSKFTQVYAPKRVRIYYGIGNIKEDYQLFQEEGIKDRLISYLECRKLSFEALREFTRTGFINQKEKK
jgi:hypothetical protein